MKLAQILKTWRICSSLNETGYGIRDISKQIGISTASLSRLENGKEISGKSMFKIMLWLFAN